MSTWIFIDTGNCDQAGTISLSFVFSLTFPVSTEIKNKFKKNRNMYLEKDF